MRYAYIRANSATWPIRRLCDLLEVHPSGYYAWRKQPHSARANENQHLTGLIKQFLLGHAKLESTVRYLGIEVDDALELAEQTEV